MSGGHSALLDAEVPSGPLKNALDLILVVIWVLNSESRLLTASEHVLTLIIIVAIVVVSM